MVPVLMILSWWVLKSRYTPVHYVAVCVCLLGVGTMVGADLLAGRDQGSSKMFLFAAIDVAIDMCDMTTVYQNTSQFVELHSESVILSVISITFNKKRRDLVS